MGFILLGVGVIFKIVLPHIRGTVRIKSTSGKKYDKNGENKYYAKKLL